MYAFCESELFLLNGLVSKISLWDISELNTNGREQPKQNQDLFTLALEKLEKEQAMGTQPYPKEIFKGRYIVPLTSYLAKAGLSISLTLGSKSQ